MYCSEEQSLGHCSGNECSYCPINNAYQEIFPSIDYMEEMESALMDALEEWDMVSSHYNEEMNANCIVIQNCTTGEQIQFLLFTEGENDSAMKPYAEAKSIMDSVEDVMKNRFHTDRVNDTQPNCNKHCSGFSLFCAEAD